MLVERKGLLSHLQRPLVPLQTYQSDWNAEEEELLSPNERETPRTSMMPVFWKIIAKVPGELSVVNCNILSEP